MDFRLIDSHWDKLFDGALRSKKRIGRLRIICPFIKQRAAYRFVKRAPYKQIQIITRFNQENFCAGVSDTLALRELLALGAQIRGVKNLHAKVYLIGDRVIVTSANLTEQALARNHEFGFFSDDPTIVSKCHQYFESLWGRAGDDLELSRIDGWDARIFQSKSTSNGKSVPSRLGDEGADLGFSAEAIAEPNPVNTAEQGFVKFFGNNANRDLTSRLVIDEVKSSESHWALAYPNYRTPRAVKEGAIMFIARMVKPTDILIYGRAIGERYVPGRDDASAADIKRRPWKERWRRYIRVKDVEFVNGTLGDGVSLNSLMSTFGPRTFRTTAKNHERGEGNVNPRHAYVRQAQVELTPEAIAWLNDRLDECFERKGRISKRALTKLFSPPQVKV